MIIKKIKIKILKNDLHGLVIIFSATDYLAKNFIPLDSPHSGRGWHVFFKARSLIAELKLWFLYPWNSKVLDWIISVID